MCEHNFPPRECPYAGCEYRNLLLAIEDVHSQHADDLCWMPANVNKIFAAAGLPPQDLRVGDISEMRKNCDRYTACLKFWRTMEELFRA